MIMVHHPTNYKFQGFKGHKNIFKDQFEQQEPHYYEHRIILKCHGCLLAKYPIFQVLFTLTVWGSTLDVRSRHQILTSKVDPNTVRIKIFVMAEDP